MNIKTEVFNISNAVADTKYNKKYYENNKILLFPEKPRELQIIEKIPCQYCGRFLTAVELNQDKKSRHYKNHCRGNPDYLYKGRKSGNFKKTPEVKQELKSSKELFNSSFNKTNVLLKQEEQQPIKSEIDIKREEKKNFREMINKLIREKTMDIDTIYKIYGKDIDKYKYIN